VTPYFLETFNNPDANLLGIINAIYDIGGAVGALFCFIFGNNLGRKKVIISGCAVGIVGAILQGTAKTVAQLLVGRIVGGIGVGELTATIGLWQAETSQAHNRGALMSIELVLCATGLLISQWINYGFGSNSSAVAYQFPIFFQIVFLVFTVILVPMLPESPRWLCARGKMDKAALSLVRLGGKGDTLDSPHVRQTLIQMEEVARLEELAGWEWFKSLIHGGPTQNGKRVLMACLVNVFQQLTGVNSVTYYVPTLLIKFIGTSRHDSLWIGGLTSIISLSFAVLPVFTIDRIGRLPILAGGAVGQAICFFVVAGLFSHLPAEGASNSKSYGIAIVSFIYIYFAIFSATWLGPSWMYGPEILPLKGRATGMGLAVVCYWLFNFLIVMITPPALKNISWKFYIILGVFNMCFVPVILWFFVETKGKSLEDLDIYFAERYHGGAELRQVEAEVHKMHDLQNVKHEATEMKENA